MTSIRMVIIMLPIVGFYLIGLFLVKIFELDTAYSYSIGVLSGVVSMIARNMIGE